MYTEDELLPLSGLQHLAFCERRWALIHLEGQWEENVFTAEGALLHEKAHSAAIESRPGVLVCRTLPLARYRLGLSGQADIVEFLPCDSGRPGIAFPRRKGSWRPFPVEYKRSRDKAGSEAYRIQVCALALCLEEMLAVEVPAEAVFDGKAKRRMEVVIYGELRGQVERLAARMHEIERSRRTPAAVYANKCGSCSMKPVCLPAAIGSASEAECLRRCAAANLRQAPCAIEDRHR
jgi:CRISPR-associated exonuclease Cas4